MPLTLWDAVDVVEGLPDAGVGRAVGGRIGSRTLRIPPRAGRSGFQPDAVAALGERPHEWTPRRLRRPEAGPAVRGPHPRSDAIGGRASARGMPLTLWRGCSRPPQVYRGGRDQPGRCRRQPAWVGRASSPTPLPSAAHPSAHYYPLSLQHLRNHVAQASACGQASPSPPRAPCRSFPPPRSRTPPVDWRAMTRPGMQEAIHDLP